MKNITNTLLFFLTLLSSVVVAQPVLGVTDFAVNGTISWNTNSPCVATKTADVQGWLVSVNSTSNCGINQSNSGGGDGRLQYLVGFGTLTQASFGTDDGSEFSLKQIAWGASTSSFTAKQINFVGYKNGMPVPGATLTAITGPLSGPTNTTIVTFTNNTAFSDVDDVRIIPTVTCSSILFFEDILIGSAVPSCATPTLTLSGNTNISCNGGSNGSATVSASGAPGFTYVWSPSGGTSAVASGLSAGVYTCVVTNSCGLTASRTVTITQPSALVTSTAVTNVACNGGSNGIGSITASGGTGSYTYVWSNGTTSSFISAAMAGAYSATVTDANNCTSTKNLVISQPAALGTTTAVTNVACNGGNTGSGTITASGGTGAGSYTYLWSTGSTASSASSLLAGAYSATVTDANSCTSVKSLVITQPSAISTSTAVTNVACNGGSNGVASITASGGAGGYTYLWSNGATTSAITGLLAGAYSATVTDANNCKMTRSAVVTQPSAMVTATAVTNVACNDGSNGVGSITATGGSGGYTYLWSNAATTSAVSGLLSGAYSATVTDANSCTSSKNITITQPSALVTSTAVTNVACNGGSNGAGSITASGGAGGYTYLWSNAATTSAISGIIAGVYSATVTDANSCTSSKNITITQPSALVTSTAISNVSCNGGANGTASISASGGVGGYTYLWSNAATTSSISGVIVGVYSATVTDANNCTSIKSAVITQPSAIATSTSVINVACNGGANGSGSITASGGTGSYTYLWSNGGTGSSVSALMAGVYTATVTDANNCKVSKNVTITQPSALVTSTAVTNVACNGGTGSGSVTASGGTGSYTYLWSNGTTGSSAASLQAGVYSATVTDANSCTSSKNITVTQPSALNINLAATNASCTTLGSATLTAGGGTGSYTYLWSNGSTSSAISSLIAGVYSATVTDANNCKSVGSATITQPASIITTTSVINVACNGGTGSVGVSATGGSQPYTYSWSTGAATSGVSGLPAGSYTATVTDASGCTNSVNVIVSQPSALTLSISGTDVKCNGGTGSATLAAGGGTGSYSYVWSNGSTGLSVNNLAAGAYSVTVTDVNNCLTSASVTITQPAVLSATANASAILCNGGISTITVSATGGVSAYAGTGTYTAFAGTSSYTITDANACQAVASVVIAQPSALAAGSTASSILCNGGASTVNISANGGTAPYSGTGSFTAVAGPHTYAVSDANGCLISTSLSIAQPANLSATASASSVLCNGGISTITVTANGGTLPYSGAGTFTMMAGSRTYTVSDANACTTTASVTIIQPAALSAGASASSILCNGNTSTITVSAAGGTAPFSGVGTFTAVAGVKTYTVSDGNGCVTTASVSISQPAVLTASYSSSPILCHGGISTLVISANGGTSPYTGAGTFTAHAGAATYTIQDNNGCQVTASVNVSEPAVLNSSALASAILCNGQISTVSVSANGGVTPYSGVGTFTMPAGARTYTVSDNNGCFATASVNVSQPPVLVASSVSSSILCNGGISNVTVTAAGGTLPYMGAGSFTAHAGALTYTLTDNNGCIASTSVSITEPAVLSANSSASAILCNGGISMVTVTATGGISSYNGTGTYTVMAGAYNYTVSDNNGCMITTSVTVTEPAVLTASASASAILCHGAISTVTVSGLGGTPSYMGTGTFTLLAGSETYTVTDNNGCMATTSVSISEPSPVSTSVSASSIFCNGGVASVSVSVSGGVSPYSGAGTFTSLAGTPVYTVSDANGCLDSASVSITEPALISSTQSYTLCYGQSLMVGTNTYTSSGTYTDRFMATNTCDSLVTTILVVNNAIDVSTTLSGNVITAMAKVTSYQWIDCANSSSIIAGETGQTLTVPGDGSYAVILTENGCSDTSACVNYLTIGLKNYKENLKISVYPNPGTGLFIVSTDAIVEAVLVTDITGRVVKELSPESGSVLLDLTAEQNGIYFVKVQTHDQQVVQRIILAK